MNEHQFVGATLATTAKRKPTAIALTWPTGQMDWATLHRAVEQFAAFIAQKSRPGAKIALVLNNGTAVLIYALASMRAGRIAMLCDADWPTRQLDEVLRATAPDLVIAHQRLHSSFDHHLCDAFIDPREISSPDCQVNGTRLPPPAPTDSFYVCFSSGSTGIPKGIRRNHASWLKSFSILGDLELIHAHTVKLTLGSFAHSTHFYAAMESLHHASQLAFLPSFRPRNAITLCEQHGVDTLVGTPTQIQLMADAAPEPIETVRTIISGGAKWPDPTPHSVQVAFPQADAIEFYGASETSFIAIKRRGETAPPGTVGRIVPTVEVRIGKPLQAGEPSNLLEEEPATGPLWIRGPQLFEGYECGEAAEISQGWVNVGDIGRLDSEGFLFLHGRQGRAISVSGQVVYAEQIEMLARSMPQIVDALAFGLPDPIRGAALTVAISTTNEWAGPADAAKLRQLCRGTLGSAHTPKHVVRLEDWPLASSGKPGIAEIEAAVRDALCQ